MNDGGRNFIRGLLVGIPLSLAVWLILYAIARVAL